MKPRIIQTPRGLEIEAVDEVTAVSNVLQIKVLSVEGLENGATVWVSGLRTSFFYDKTSTAIADDVEIVRPNNGIGRWVREHTAHADAAGSVDSVTQATDARLTALPQGSLARNASGGLVVDEVALPPSLVDQMPTITALVLAGYRRFRFLSGVHVLSTPLGPFPYSVYGLVGAGNALDYLGRSVGWPSNIHITFDPGAIIEGQFADMVDQSHTPFWSIWMSSTTGNTSLTADITAGAKTCYVDSLVATTPAIAAGAILIVCKLNDGQGRSQIYDVVSTSPATKTGSVDLTGLVYPADFGTKNITVTHGGVARLCTFASPANAGEVVSQLNAAIIAGFGSAVIVASLDAAKYLKLTGTTGSVMLTNGTLAAATVGFTSAIATGVAVTVERAIKFDWVASDSFVSTKLRRPENIVIDGGAGGKIVGNVSRTLELVGSRDCTAQNLVLEPTTIGDGYSAGCDVPSFRYTWRNCKLTSTANTGAVYGIGVEAGEEALFERCHVVAPFTNAAYQLYDGISCRFVDCQGEAAAGVLIKRSQDTKLVNCEFSQCTTAGVLDDADCTRLDAYGVVALACARGFNPVGKNAKLSSCIARQSTAVGYYISGANARLSQCESEAAPAGFWTEAANTVYDRCISSNTTSYDFSGSKGWTAIDCETTGSALYSISGLNLEDGETVVIRGGTYRSGAVAPAGWPFAHRVASLTTAARANARWVFDGVTFVLGSASAIGVIWEHALKSVTFRNCRWILNGAPAGTTAIYAGAATSVWLLGNNDFSACATGINAPGAAAKFSRGSIALTGATPVTYAFPDIKASNSVKVTRSVAGGTAAEFTAAISVGVGVVLTGTAGDTSTITIEID